MAKQIVVIEGPSGVGKDTIIANLVKKYPGTYIKMPSITSRQMRSGERQGHPYFFVSKSEFEKKIKDGEVFEHTIRHDEYRGMSRRLIDDLLAKSLIPMKDCDMIGVNALKKNYPGKVFTIFVKASKDEIMRRLIKRGDNDADRKVRLDDYENKMAQEKYFDVSVENKDLNETVAKIHEIISAQNRK